MAYATTMTPFQSHSDEPYDPGMRISWSGILAGTALGWAAFSLLALIASAIGLAKLDPMSTQPANGLGTASGIVGALLLVATSFFGAYMAVRISGNRRQRDALVHGGVCWAISMLIGAMLAMGAASTAAQSAATVASGPRAQAKADRESRIRSNNGGPTASDRQRADEAADTAAKTTGAGAAGAVLALAASLLGAFAAARHRSTRSNQGKGLRRGDLRDDVREHRVLAEREKTVIVPPAG